MNIDLQGRNALVMGASRGIGKGIAHGLATSGANVCIVARNPESLRSAEEDIRNAGRGSAISVLGDLARLADIEKAFAFARENLGDIDILINNAGGPKFGSLQTLSEKDWDAAIDLTLRSTIRMTALAVPYMIKKEWGRIVTVTSTLAREPTSPMILSATMRAGVTAFMKALSHDLASQGVTANVVAPGGVLTDRVRDLISIRAKSEKLPYEDLLRESEQSIPIGRFATPEEFSAYVVFLCSDEARYITGTVLNVDGGLSKALF